MEDNIHDDKLDDYVRASFEDYEASPPGDMWDRVEAGLPPTAVASPLRTAFLNYRWQLAAAAVILLLLSTLVCEHIAYEDKLRALTEQPTTAPGQWSPSEQRPGQSQAPKQRVEHIDDTSPKAAPKSYPSTGEKGFVAEHEAQSVGQKPARNSSDDPKTAQRAFQEKPVPLVVVEKTPNQLTNVETSLAGVTAPLPQQSEASAGQQALLDRTCILLKPGMLNDKDNRVLPAVPVLHFEKPPVKRYQEPSGWYLGTQTALLATHEKRHSQSARPGRPLFQNKQQNTGLSMVYGLSAGKKINAKLSLETGLAYQKSVQTSTHSPRFRFGEGVHWGMGKRSFDYEVSTYSGTAEVSLRMDQSTPGNPPSDDEPVTLKITTREQTEILRIPLLARYQWGEGRLQGQIKAGGLANIILNNTLELSARESENTRFMPVDGQDGYTLRLSKPGGVSMGYWLSAGASYKLTKHISLVAEPAICGDFARKDQSGRRLPEHVLFGLNVGANYYF